VVVSVMTLSPLKGGFWVDLLTPPSTPDAGRDDLFNSALVATWTLSSRLPAD
jgi:hypothetical protein